MVLGNHSCIDQLTELAACLPLFLLPAAAATAATGPWVL